MRAHLVRLPELREDGRDWRVVHEAGVGAVGAPHVALDVVVQARGHAGTRPHVRVPHLPRGRGAHVLEPAGREHRRDVHDAVAAQDVDLRLRDGKVLGRRVRRGRTGQLQLGVLQPKRVGERVGRELGAHRCAAAGGRGARGRLMAGRRAPVAERWRGGREQQQAEPSGGRAQPRRPARSRVRAAKCKPAHHARLINNYIFLKMLRLGPSSSIERSPASPQSSSPR